MVGEIRRLKLLSTKKNSGARGYGRMCEGGGEEGTGVVAEFERGHHRSYLIILVSRTTSGSDLRVGLGVWLWLALLPAMPDKVRRV